MSLLGLCSIRVLISCLALSTTIQAQEYVFRAYRQSEGLKNLSVNGLTTGSNGFLWVATENGVYRFLGSRFEHFGREQGIADPDIHDILADSGGVIWAATDENLYRLNGERFLPAVQTPIAITGPHRLAAEDGRHLLVVDKMKIYRLEHDAEGRTLSYVPLLPDSLVASIPDLARISSVGVVPEPPNRQRIWAVCGKELCSWLDRDGEPPSQHGDAGVIEWGTKEGLPAFAWDIVVRDHTGTIWVAGENHVFVLPIGSGRFLDRSISGAVSEHAFGHIVLVEDQAGRMIASADDGIARWEAAGWHRIGRTNGLGRSNRISSIAFDSSGDLWLGSRGDGVYQWVGYQNWEGWGDEQGLPSATIWSIRPKRDGLILVGTERGPGWINPDNGKAGRLSSIENWAYGQVSAVGEDPDGHLWAGTFSGAILQIDSKTGKTVEIGRLPAPIISAFEYEPGHTLLATNQGIFLRLAGSVPRRLPGGDALLAARSTAVAACGSPGGAVWFLGNNRFARFQNGTLTESSVVGMPDLHGSLLALSCSADGTIWVTGDRTGTWHLKPTAEGLQAFQLSLPPEFTSLAPLAILADSRGWVWLGTDLGLLGWNGRSWRHFSDESGVIWNDLDQGVLEEGRDGSLWVGTSGGVSHLPHPEAAFDNVPLDVSVTGIQRDGPLDPSKAQITLPWVTKPLYFQLSSAAMRNRSELVFKYRMAGLQPDWTESQSGLAVFSSLPPGNYTFEAMAANFSIGASSDTIKVAVQILAPWWRSTWFFALCGLVFALFLVAANRFYSRQLKKRAIQLEGMVSERTLELEGRTRELEVSREQLRIQASQDGLTGMLNHVSVLRALAAEMDRARRRSETMVLAMVDLDHFKRINDAYGHPAGDEALRSFAAATRTATRVYDHAGRYGGEEFLLILTQIPREAVEHRLNHLHTTISNLEVQMPEAVFTITCSVGATVFDPSAGNQTAESLLTFADQALYAAKAAGRNCVVFREAGCLNPANQDAPAESTQSA